MYAVYAYYDFDLNQHVIWANELNWKGNWDGGAQYQAASRDAVQYGDDKYICINDTVGITPEDEIANQPWCILALLYEGDEPPFSPGHGLPPVCEPIHGWGTVPYSTNSNGTIAYDFCGDVVQETTIGDGPLYVTGTNLCPGSTIQVLLDATGTDQPIAYDPSIKWYGFPPPTHIDDKGCIYEFTCTGSGTSMEIQGKAFPQDWQVPTGGGGSGIGLTAGVASIPPGASGGTVSGLNLARPPQAILLTVQAPVGGELLFATVIGNATVNGFTYALSGLTDSPAYALNYAIF